MKELRTTNALLLIIVVPLVLYLLKVLSFIFVPLFFSMFITLLFLPMMRWLHKMRVPRAVSVLVVILIFVTLLKIGGELVQLAVKEITSTEEAFFERAGEKILDFVVIVEEFFGIDRIEDENLFMHYLKSSGVMEDFGSAVTFVGDTVSVTLMTILFTILMLSESINFQMMLNRTIIKSRYSSIKLFVIIERDIIRFVKVKVFVSILTGIAVGLLCLIFGISFPILWGLVAFATNFVQMIGSIFTVIILSLFALVELDPSGTLLLFVLILTGLQLLFGSVLEPILMGRTFSVNIVSVIVMLMLWGYLWGIPGMIMAVPITVSTKIILDQFPRTKAISSLMGGYNREVTIPWKKGKKS